MQWCERLLRVVVWSQMFYCFLLCCSKVPFIIKQNGGDCSRKHCRKRCYITRNQWKCHHFVRADKPVPFQTGTWRMFTSFIWISMNVHLIYKDTVRCLLVIESYFLPVSLITSIINDYVAIHGAAVAFKQYLQARLVVFTHFNANSSYSCS